MVFRGFNHTKTPMARFAPRVTTASLLALLAIAATGPMVVSAHAQEAERPTGLFDRIFSGSERFGGGSERRAVRPIARRRCPTPTSCCASTASKPRSGSSPA